MDRRAPARILMSDLGPRNALLELPERLPEPGELVGVRSCRWLVDEVVIEPPPAVVRLACADDDAQGERLDVFWELELDREIIREEGWDELAARGFDDPQLFAAFFNTLRWSSVTATDPNLFQSPFRAGIRIDAYRMEPLRKALRLPRVNLFIADDTGLGKTIEAGLIARELLLRKRAKTIVVAAPPSVLEQWQAELEERFGLTFDRSRSRAGYTTGADSRRRDSRSPPCSGPTAAPLHAAHICARSANSATSCLPRRPR